MDTLGNDDSNNFDKNNDDFLSLCTKNKLNLLAKKDTLVNDTYNVSDYVYNDDDMLLNDDGMMIGCQSNHNSKYNSIYSE